MTTTTPPYTLTGSPSLRRARREQLAAALFTALARWRRQAAYHRCRECGR